MGGSTQPVTATKPSREKNEYGLTEGQERFAQLVAQDPKLPLVSAYSEAYVIERDKLESDNVAWIASRLYNSPKIKARIEVIQQQCRTRFIDLAPKAIDQIENLSNNGKNEMVRLKAAQEILHQSGLIPPTRVEAVHVGIFGQASAEDVRAILRKNLENREEKENASV